MEYHKFDHHIVLRVDPGEEVAAVIKEVTRAENIPFATISGIGAVKRVTLAFYHSESYEYRTNFFPGAYEFASMNGNVMCVDGEPHMHLHVTIADRGHRIYGGHLLSAYVTATCEVVLSVIPAKLHRVASPETGLNVISFSNVDQKNMC